jgi:multisubunit Na+/H+ antiporter MnhG subunit
MKDHSGAKTLAILIGLSLFAFLVQGYHPGVEDDGVYLAAIKRDLNPALYPHDADFFRVQLQATIFDKLIAGSIRLTPLPPGVTILLWQFASVVLILWGCLRIGRRVFRESHAQWAGVVLVAALLTLPVAGTALYLDDQYLHPRALATAAILAAVVAVLDRRRILAGFLLVLAFVIHPLMASFGISYCIFLCWRRVGNPSTFLAAAMLPLGWVFQPTSPAWQQAAITRDYYFLGRWQWYEWLGVIAPLFLLWGIYRLGRKNGCMVQAHVASRLAWFGVFQLVVAVAIMVPSSLDRLKPFQPMRFLHLLYLIFFLLAGGLIGQRILGRHAYRWLLLFVPLAVGMFWAQRQTFPATAHLEWPGAKPANSWVEAFEWIRQNTPCDSLFALDPYYMKLPGEDFHSFRALAERSALADYVKDPSVATQVPSLAVRWKEEVDAQKEWRNFRAEDFQRLKFRFGVSWVVLVSPGVQGMDCPFQNHAVRVCRIPDPPDQS